MRTAALLAGVILLAACEKGGPQDILGTLPGARIKFFNFSVGAPSVNFFAGETKMTAISSATGTESTVGTAYGAAGAAGLYTAIAPGAYAFSGRISAATDNNLAVSQLQATLENGKAYSFFMSGFYDAVTKRAESFLVEDDVPDSVGSDGSLDRFVNAIPNSGPLQLIVRNPTTTLTFPIGSAVAYKGATPFVKLAGSGIVDLVIRAQGSSTDLFTRTAVSLLAGRVYTIAARGDITVTSTTAANRPQLDVTANR